MKIKDIQKTVKGKELSNINDRALDPIYYQSALLRKKISQKMQREKLYKLHKTAYFIAGLFVFKIGKIFNDQIFAIWK